MTKTTFAVLVGMVLALSGCIAWVPGETLYYKDGVTLEEKQKDEKECARYWSTTACMKQRGYRAFQRDYI